MHRLLRVHETGFFHPQDVRHHCYKELHLLKIITNNNNTVTFIMTCHKLIDLDCLMTEEYIP